MTSPQTFRSQFNGFHRDDVVHYISFLSQKHDSVIAELRAEAEELRGKLAACQDVPDRSGELEELESRLEVVTEEKSAAEAALAELQAQIAVLQTAVSAKEEALSAGEQALEKAEAENASLRDAMVQKDAELEALKQELRGVKNAAAQQPAAAEGARSWSEELNAYRRAERTERRARERVNQMYDQANGALAEGSVRMERAAADIGSLIAKVEADLKLLQQAMAESGNAMADTAVLLGSIRPELD